MCGCCRVAEGHRWRFRSESRWVAILTRELHPIRRQAPLATNALHAHYRGPKRRAHPLKAKADRFLSPEQVAEAQSNKRTLATTR